MIICTKKTRLKRIVLVVYWLAFIGLVLFLFNRWSNLMNDAGYAHSNEDFSLQDDFYENFGVFQDAAGMLWNHQSIFRWEDGRRRPLFLSEEETLSDMYIRCQLEKTVGLDDWRTIEKLNAIKRFSYIGYISSRKVMEKETLPGIVFIFPVKNRQHRGHIRMYYFLLDTIAETGLNDILKNTFDLLKEETDGTVYETKKPGWYYEEIWKQ